MNNDLISCAIIDDEPLALQLLDKYVHQTPYLSLVGSYYNPNRLLDDIRVGLSPDLLICDIEMPQLNGLDLCQLLPPTVKIIFATAYSQYAVQGYKLRASGYLLKPISYDDFLAATRRVSDERAIERQAALNSQPQTICVRVDHRNLILNVDTIDRVEGYGDYVKFFLSDGRVVLSLMRLRNVCDLLPRDRFAQVHKSHIVRTAAISSFSNRFVTVASSQIPVGPAFRDHLLQALS